jgi:polyhydroxybutyrate depolymerase
MRRPILALLLVLVGTGAAVRISNKNVTEPNPDQFTTEPGFHELSVKTTDATRPFLLYIPKSLDTTKPAPLVFFLHGGGGSMKQAKSYNLQDKAEEAGFVLVLPNGTGALRDDGILATWNAGECCGGARDRDIDDVGYIREIVKSVEDTLSIDSNRIYATGMSNGGMMSYRLACDAADVFAAIAPVAGTDNTVTCSPSEPISVLHIHALDDTHVLYNGGAGEDAFRDDTKVTDFTSVNDTINRWLTYNKLPSEPKRTLTVAGAYCDSYEGTSDTEVRLCVTESGGHSWPGSTVGQILRDKQPSQAINANDVIWDFFSTHSK